jgi:hypothetical protein
VVAAVNSVVLRSMLPQMDRAELLVVLPILICSAFLSPFQSLLEGMNRIAFFVFDPFKGKSGYPRYKHICRNEFFYIFEFGGSV